MDSGNSGSLQSSRSSAGDEEYDSRATESTLSAFFNSTTTGPPPLTSDHHPPPPTPPFFDPLSYLSTPNPNPNPFLNLDRLRPWPTPNPTCTDHTSSLIASSALNLPPIPDAAPRSSKKRSRASRRAPTTVLTTDTTNFRAMVQEFTGIPAPPFASSSSPFPRSLFNSPATPPPPYPLRPFAQKGQQHPFFGITPSSSTTTCPIANANTHATDNIYQLPFMNFQSPKYSLPSAMPRPRAPAPAIAPIGGNYGAVCSDIGFPTLIASEAIQSRNQAEELCGLFGGEEHHHQNPQKLRRSTEFNADKGSERVSAARGEDMLESWICSSD